MKKWILCFTAILLVLMAGFASAGTVNLPQTGQTICYNTLGTVIPCPRTGQDGEIQAGVDWPEPRFTINDDTTITDNLTGLVWASDGNIMPNRDLGWDIDGTLNDGYVTWQHALDYVAKLNAENYLGHSDWRLPNVNEFESLSNNEEVDLTPWLESEGFTNVQPYSYWSSTTHAYHRVYAWFFIIWCSSVNADNKDYPNGCVWPVRAGQCGLSNHSAICLPQTGQKKCFNESGREISCTGTGQDGEIQAGVAWPAQRFTDKGNTVIDNLTGLMWTKNANLPRGPKNWQEALDYVKRMNAGIYDNFGYTDWRLPNRNELQSLTDYSVYHPALPVGHPFTHVQVQAYDYWSSTSTPFYTYFAWFVSMSSGGEAFMKKSVNYYIWPVRAGLAGPLDN